METKTEFDRRDYQRLDNLTFGSSQKYSKLSRLESLPTLVLEQICNYLDGDTNVNLREASPHLNEAIDHIQSGRNGQKYWLAQCLAGVQPSLLNMVLNSFSTIIGGWTPQHIKQTSMPEDFTNYTWKHVFVCGNKLVEKCTDRSITFERLTHIEGFVNERFTFPCIPSNIGFSTTGSTLFYVVSPKLDDDEPNLYAFERMGSYKLGTLFKQSRQDKIFEYRVMTLPMDTSLLESSKLPEIRTILVFPTDVHIAVASLIVGTTIKLTMNIPELQASFPRLQVSKRFAIWGNFIASWQSPNVILLYRVKLSVTGIPVAEIVNTIILDGKLNKFWCNIFESPVEYTAILEFRTSDAYELQRTDFHQVKPFFSILSPTRTSCIVTYGHQNALFGFLGNVIETDPKLVGKPGFIPSIRNHGVLRGHKVEQSNVYFWSDRWLIKRIRDSIWQCQKLHPLVLETNERIQNLEISTSDIIIVLTNENFFIIQSMQETSGSVSTSNPYGDPGMPGGLFLKVIRKIPVTSIMPPHLRVTYFHFDLELGEPYIFLVGDSIYPEDRTSTSYELIKMKFTDRDAESEKGFRLWKLK